jgi:hypothetical protein
VAVRVTIVLANTLTGLEQESQIKIQTSNFEICVLLYIAVNYTEGMYFSLGLNTLSRILHSLNNEIKICKYYRM